jgi:hypothetical protein
MSERAYSVDAARAVYHDGFLVVHAVISVTATNFEPYLERSPILIFPPPNEFSAMEKQTADVGGQIIIPKSVTQQFPQPADKPDSITISAKSNKLSVKVDEMDPLAPSTQVLRGAFKSGEEARVVATNGGGEIPSPHKEAMAFNDTAIGYSQSFSFEDAFSDAVRKLPAVPQPIDGLTSVRVTGVGGEFGGIAGIQRLWVSVSRATLRT